MMWNSTFPPWFNDIPKNVDNTPWKINKTEDFFYYKKFYSTSSHISGANSHLWANSAKFYHKNSKNKLNNYPKNL